MAICNQCGKDIVFAPTGGCKPDGKPAYRPVNPDGTLHRCTTGGAPAPTAAAKIEEGVLVSVAGNGVIVNTPKGDRTYAIAAPLREVALPAKIKYVLKERGFIEVMEMTAAAPLPPKEEFRTAAEIAKENPDRLNGPADGECVTEPLIRPPTATVKDSLTVHQPCGDPCTCSTTPHTPAGVRMWSGDTRLTIGSTINLENYENLRIEVSGAAADRENLISFLDETLGQFGGKSEITKNKIEAYRRRVLG